MIRSVAIGAAILVLAAGCGTSPVKLEVFCAEQYEKVTLDGAAIGAKLVAQCLDKMKVCTPEELGNESDNLARGYTPPCHFLEQGACKSSCLEFWSSRKSG